ncbi:hypothetical protein [Microbacterium rhizomatis]|uniref:Modulator of FtsH protease n=1 Tax=Microbacterium rhizomatis TaxID=1631477 RepID=A0A5J5IZ35_9MICO|nr:hypothetical protein [Microbacterium rhizomatis]KAA9107586.1 hypothetical protein F6B43_08955 [Microbacterium rhizomatis]
MGATVEGWSEFNVAMAGATAALAGLMIVAASVNIADIVKEKSLTARLAAGVAGLVLALISSAIGLIPEVTIGAYGIAMLVISLLAAVFGVEAARQIYANRHPDNHVKLVKSLVCFAAPAAYLVGSVLLVAGAPSGLVWFAAGSLIAIVSSLLVSWIVLVEVLR